jgi:signal transduction histidine kinase
LAFAGSTAPNVQMPVSKRFLSLVNFQLAQFADRSDVTSVVVYVTEPDGSGEPDLIPVGHWPSASRSLPALTSDSDLHQPAERRRWLAMRQGGVLLGALLVETTELPWPEPLQQRLQAVSHCLTESLCLDLEHHQLQLRLHQQRDQLRVLVHQLRNPLAALRTFGQLLLRRLEHDPRNRPLVEGLLQEEHQLQRYVDAIDALERLEPAIAPAGEATPLLLPPSLGNASAQPLATQLQPLLQRATATATLQGRPWSGPDQLPQWQGDAGSVAEILANLLENAFRYSRPGAAVGLHVAAAPDGGAELCVWDGGDPIAPGERERIFEPGERGRSSVELPGSGLGLALARQLARQLGGDLRLEPSPAQLGEGLPEQGNAFLLRLPPGTPPAP